MTFVIAISQRIFGEGAPSFSCVSPVRPRQSGLKRLRAIVFLSGPERIPFPQRMPIDPREFMHHLDGLNLDEAQKVELIHTVAAFMESVIDQEFGTHPVQLALAARQNRNSSAPESAVNSNGSVLLEPFNRFAAKRAKHEAS